MPGKKDKPKTRPPKIHVSEDTVDRKFEAETFPSSKKATKKKSTRKKTAKRTRKK